MKKEIILMTAAALAGGLTVFAITGVAGEHKGDNVYVEESAGESVPQSVTVKGDYPDFCYAAETAVEAVVYVKVTVQSQMIQGPSSIFDFFFGMPGQSYQGPSQQERVGSGSGVIIRPDGYIVTNNHVVQDASKIEVTLNNNKTYEATLVGTDPATDVAIIKIEADKLPAIQFEDSDRLRLGEWVLAIGSPYDLRSTITAGIVSAKGRSMPNYGKELKIESFIQTDAAVNPGNSGGALVNKQGRLVGVNTAIISQTGSYAGYSFAIPSNIVKKISDDLITYGAVKRVSLGVMVSEIDAKKADKLKLSSPSGVYIEEVLKDSAAQQAGIKEGDVIVGVNATKIGSFSVLQEALSQFRPGDKATIKVIRDGKLLEIPLTFIDTGRVNGEVVEGGLAFYGAVLTTAPEEVLRKYSLKSGVLVSSLEKGKMKDAGAQKGMIICYVNDEPVSTPQDVMNAVKNSKRAVYVEGVTPGGVATFFGFAL